MNQLSMSDLDPGKDKPVTGKSNSGQDDSSMGLFGPGETGQTDSYWSQMLSTHGRIFFIDFSTTRGLAVAINEGDPFIVDEMSLGYFVKGVHPRSPKSGELVILETNYEMHKPSAHNEVNEICEEREVQLGVFSLRQTGRYKNRIDIARGSKKKVEAIDRLSINALEKLKALCETNHIVFHEHDDMNAVEAIRWVFRDGQHFSPPRWYDEVELDDLQQFNRLRTSKLLEPGVAWQNEWVKEKLLWFPLPVEFTQMHPDLADVIVRKNDHRHDSYTISLLLLWIIMAEESNNREEFDRKCGLYAHGYPGIARSTAIRRAASLAKRELDNRSISGIVLGIDSEGKQAFKDASRRVRRTARLIYRMVRERDEGQAKSADAG